MEDKLLEMNEIIEENYGVKKEKSKLKWRVGTRIGAGAYG